MHQNTNLQPPEKQNSSPSSLKILLVTLLALVAFAANSVLCRLALQSSNIDPASFTSLRLISGALTLWILLLAGSKNKRLNIMQILSPRNKRAWYGATLLFTYAVCFSFAYVILDTATGALILFATVQISLLASHLFQGNRFGWMELIGISMAIFGFVLLMLPSATQPNWVGFLLMFIAGVAWACYTLEGRSSQQPTINTAENFIRCVPISVLLWLALYKQVDINAWGLLWAVLSGSVASGIGYSLWYYVLKYISVTQSAISQLSVPLLAAIGGIVLLGESVSNPLIVSGILISLGILLVTLAKPHSLTTTHK